MFLLVRYEFRRWGNTPLDEAWMCGNKNLIKLLETAKAAQLSQSSGHIEEMLGNQLIDIVSEFFLLKLICRTTCYSNIYIYIYFLVADKKLNKKCTVFPFHPWGTKEIRKPGIVLWVTRTIDELIKLASEKLKFPTEGSCILSEDGGKILDVDMIENGQKLYMISETE